MIPISSAKVIIKINIAKVFATLKKDLALNYLFPHNDRQALWPFTSHSHSLKLTRISDENLQSPTSIAQKNTTKKIIHFAQTPSLYDHLPKKRVRQFCTYC